MEYIEILHFQNLVNVIFLILVLWQNTVVNALFHNRKDDFQHTAHRSGETWNWKQLDLNKFGFHLDVVFSFSYYFYFLALTAFRNERLV